MLFVIRKIEGDDGVPEAGIGPVADCFQWTLFTVEKGEPKEPVAKSVRFFDTEKACRSDIATAKIRLKAARFARVQGTG